MSMNAIPQSGLFYNNNKNILFLIWILYIFYIVVDYLYINKMEKNSILFLFIDKLCVNSNKMKGIGRFIICSCFYYICNVCVYTGCTHMYIKYYKSFAHCDSNIYIYI